MIKKDDERINNIFQLMSESSIRYLLSVDDTLNYYLSGAYIDYSIILLDSKDENVIGFVNVMEGERASKSSWIDKIILYGGAREGFESIDADNPIDALAKYIDQEGNIGVSFDRIDLARYNLIKSKLGDRIIDISEVLWKARMKKSRYEQDLIAKAGELVDYGIHRSVKDVRIGMKEIELSNHARCEMYKYGADKVYDFLIVASGVNSSNPHWRASEKKIGSGILKLDYVASYKGYYGDETRTVFLGNVKDEELKKIYEIVLDAQVTAIDHIEPGVRASEIDSVAREIIEKSGYGKYFIHSTGHGLGIEVHEKPRLSRKDDTILLDGYVVTVEPGIYLPNKGGVRIEDMVLVTKSGHKVLTRINKALTIVEV